MPAAHGRSAGASRRAVVLGAGGVVGTAWMIGLASGMRRHGVDLAETDLIVGTSAGAIVGAMLATGEGLDRFAEVPRQAGTGAAATQVDQGLLAQVFTVLADPGLEPAEARRRAGQLALAAATDSEQAHIARMGSLIGARDWPDGGLLLAAVDADTGEPVVLDRAAGVPLLRAVAASCAMPGAYPPITVNGRRYIDGGLASATNADLARDSQALVIVEPLAHLYPGEAPGSETAAGVARTITSVAPDPGAVAAFGPDLFGAAAWVPAYRAGVRQSADAARRILAAGWARAGLASGQRLRR
jgi:NTE family protein